jgi:hypothetical protein
MSAIGRLKKTNINFKEKVIVISTTFYKRIQAALTFKKFKTFDYSKNKNILMFFV